MLQGCGPPASNALTRRPAGARRRECRSRAADRSSSGRRGQRQQQGRAGVKKQISAASILCQRKRVPLRAENRSRRGGAPRRDLKAVAKGLAIKPVLGCGARPSVSISRRASRSSIDAAALMRESRFCVRAFSRKLRRIFVAHAHGALHQRVFRAQKRIGGALQADRRRQRVLAGGAQRVDLSRAIQQHRVFRVDRQRENGRWPAYISWPQ